MTNVTIHQAKTNLSKLIAEVEAGGNVTIMRGSTPVVKLTPVAEKTKRVFGSMKGQIAIDERFFEPLPEEELRLWNCEDD